jgi:hypothetical protein
MNQNTITYLVEYYTNNNIVKSEYLTNEVTFKKKQNFYICDLTISDVFQTIRAGVEDLESTQCEIIMGMTTMDGKTYLGVPNIVKVSLTAFQVRRSKLSLIIDILDEV